MMTKWFHNPVSGQVFDLDADNADAIRAALQNGAVEIDDPADVDESPENPPDNGGKSSRRKSAAKDDGGNA